MQDDAELSLRDLALLMITISDNAAADAVLDTVGLDAVQQTVDDCALTDTAIVASCRDQYDTLVDDLARGGLSLAQRLTDPYVLQGFPRSRPRHHQPQHPARHDHAPLPSLARRGGQPTGGDEMRRMLRLQVCRHRLGSGFPSDDVRVAGKTGNLLNLRGEIGVVEPPTQIATPWPCSPVPTAPP